MIRQFVTLRMSRFVSAAFLWVSKEVSGGEDEEAFAANQNAPLVCGGAAATQQLSPHLPMSTYPLP